MNAGLRGALKFALNALLNPDILDTGVSKIAAPIIRTALAAASTEDGG